MPFGLTVVDAAAVVAAVVDAAVVAVVVVFVVAESPLLSHLAKFKGL